MAMSGLRDADVLGSVVSTANQAAPQNVSATTTGLTNMYNYDPTGMVYMDQPRNMQPMQGGIVDPSYLAQLEILNQPQVVGAQFQPMGSGLINAVMGGGGGNLIIPDYRPQARQFRQDLVDIYNATSGGGDGGEIAFNPNQDFGYFSGRTPSVNYSIPVSDALVQTVNPDGSLTPNVTVSPVAPPSIIPETPLGPIGGGGGWSNPGVQDSGAITSPVAPPSVIAETPLGPIGGWGDGGSSVSGGGGADGGFGFGGVSASDTGNIGFGGGSLGGFADDGASGGGGGGGKIICTAMNHAYGFGSFRNAIWIAYADKHLTKAHEVGYHTLFLPLVAAAYKHNKWYSKTVRKVLEHGTRHRTADLRAEMRGTKRDTLGRFYRSIFEPLCYAVGKLKGY